MTVETKINKGMKSILNFLDRADESTLNFIGMKEDHRDRLLSYDLQITEDKNMDFMSIVSNPFEKYNKITFNSTLCDLNDRHMLKVLAHEIGHANPSKPFGGVIASFAYNVCTFPLKSPVIRSLITSYGVYCTATESVISGSALIAAPAIALYPSRLAEKYCDDLADRLVPEVSYSQLQQAFINNMKKLNASEQKKYLNSISESNSFFAPVSHLFRPHPSQYSRCKSSENKCSAYLSEKKRIGIPSLLDANKSFKINKYNM